MKTNDGDADSFEDYITKNNNNVTPSEHLMSLHPSTLWISQSNQLKRLSRSIESLVIQGGVGRDGGMKFKLSKLPSLLSLAIGHQVYEYCHSVVFESKTD